MSLLMKREKPKNKAENQQEQEKAVGELAYDIEFGMLTRDTVEHWDSENRMV